MTLPPVIRIFFAIDLPELVKKELGIYINALKKQSRTHSIRWSKPENLHITLQFLGQAEAQGLPLLINQVHDRLENCVKELSINLGYVHLFPSHYRPRVIVLDVNPQNVLTELSETIGQGMQAANYPIENRPFKAHLTLGRIKQPQGIDLKFLSQVSLPSLENIEVKEVVLFRSQPMPEGSQYTKIAKLALQTSLEKKQDSMYL